MITWIFGFFSLADKISYLLLGFYTLLDYLADEHLWDDYKVMRQLSCKSRWILQADRLAVICLLIQAF